jgi:chemotaxis methyl-accepting protein methylase
VSATFDASLLEGLAAQAAQLTGFSDEAILPDAIRRVAAGFARTLPPEQLLARAVARDPDVVHALCQAVSVGETYFFRHPEHFRFVSTVLVPELVDRGSRQIRAWSAGCATGEETYSIAACLLDSVPYRPEIEIEVIGTDLISRNLATARKGSYGAWSQRPNGPLLHPLFHALPGNPSRVEIDERVRQRVRFLEHNLLDPALEGPFDLIFCRNVLVYFAHDAIGRALRHLSDALAPGGALVFSSMDATQPPPGLKLAGAPEEQIYRKPDPSRAHRPQRAAPAPPPPRLLTPLPVARRTPEPVALHLRALVHIERGEKSVAEKALAELSQAAPDYVPGILERALLHGRAGERGQASTLMREVLRRIEKLPEDEMLAGPEPLPVRFYRESAETYLRGVDR